MPIPIDKSIEKAFEAYVKDDSTFNLGFLKGKLVTAFIYGLIHEGRYTYWNEKINELIKSQWTKEYHY